MAPRKRPRNDAAQRELDQPVMDVQNDISAPDRKDVMAQVARRRAAHFANFKDEDDDTEANIHVGSDDIRTLGPWSTAVELVNERENAATARGDKVAKQKQAAETQELLVDWQPSRDPGQGPRGEGRVRPLEAVCVDLVVRHIDAVESLVGLPDTIKVKLAQAVCARRKMSPQVAALFTEGSWGEVEVQDCTQLDAAAMRALLQACITPRIERVELGSCGRGFGDDAAKVLARAGPLSQLSSLRLQGAYRLSDEGLLAAVKAAPNLTRLAVPQAARVTGAAVAKLAALVPGLMHLDLTDCRGIEPSSLQGALLHLPALRSVSLYGIFEVSDTLVTQLASLPSLRDLNLGCCKAVTDKAITHLATRRPALEALALDECATLSDTSLQAVASSCKALTHLSVRRCSKFTDSGLAAVAAVGTLHHLQASGATGLGPLTMAALARDCKHTLQFLDVSLCRNIPARAFGQVADSCEKLEEMWVFGCTQLTREVAYGHSNDRLKVVGLPTMTA